MDEETWKELPDWPYLVSSLGNIRRVGKGKNLKPSKNSYGYLIVTLYGNGGRRIFFVHRLVAAAFLGPSNLQVNHLDKVRSNNVLTNLEYVTDMENKTHLHNKKYPGCCYHKLYDNWQARIGINGKRIHLGSFKTQELAFQAYLDALNLYGLKNKYAKGGE